MAMPTSAVASAGRVVDAVADHATGLGLCGRDRAHLSSGSSSARISMPSAGDGLGRSGPLSPVSMMLRTPRSRERRDTLDRVGSRFVTQRDETDRLGVRDDDDHGLARVLQGGDAVGGKALRPAALHRMAW